MNTISSINSFAWKSQSVSVNSWDYISSKLAKTITFNISGGTNYVALANTVSYANTAIGINQVTPNTTFLQCLSGSSFLKTSDFASSSFTFYVKYQMRNASLSTNVWNKQSPMITFSRAFIGPSQSFTVSFLSTYPVVNVPYTISDIVTGDITNAALSGNLNGYNNTFSYVSSTTSRKTFTFTAGGVTKSVSFLSALYTVTVAGGVFYISTNGGVSSKQPNLPFTSGGLYVFDQSDATNVGNRLVLGTGPDTGRSDTNVVFNGTPGSANAYTLIDLAGIGTVPSYYFSSTTTGMGNQPTPTFYIIRATDVTKYDPVSSTVYTLSFANPQLCNFINGNLYICAWGSNQVFKMSPTGTISLFAGTGTAGNDGNGGQATAAKIKGPGSICGDSFGNFYVSSTGSYNNIRKIDSAGIITNIAGGAVDATGGVADNVQGMVVIDGFLYYCEKWINHCVRKINLTSLAITTVAGTRGAEGYLDGPATSGLLSRPWGIAFDSNLNMYINDSNNNKIRKVTPAGVMSTFKNNSALGIFIRYDMLYYISGVNIQKIDLGTGIESTVKTVTNFGYLAVD